MLPELAMRASQTSLTARERIGQMGKFTFMARLKPGGAEKFSRVLAGYYEAALGTAHDAG